MAKINFQFYACRTEIAAFLLDNAREFDLTIILINRSPIFYYRAKHFNSISVSDILTSNEIMLFPKGFVVDSTDYFQFLQSNNNFINIWLGYEDEERLCESILTAVGDCETMILWKKIVNQLKRSMLRGVWVHSADGKTADYYSSYRYSLLAKEKFEQGCKICPIAENCTVELKSNLE